MIELASFLIPAATNAAASALVEGVNMAMKTIKRYWEGERGTIRISSEQAAKIDAIKAFIQPDSSNLDQFVTAQYYQLCCALLAYKKDINEHLVINTPPNLRGLADYGYYANPTMYIQNPELTSQLANMSYYFVRVQETSRSDYRLLQKVFENNIETLIYPVMFLCLIKLALSLANMRVISQDMINTLKQIRLLLRKLYEHSSSEYKKFAPLTLKYFEGFFDLAEKLCICRLRNNYKRYLLEQLRGITFMNADRAYKLAISMLCSNNSSLKLINVADFLMELDIITMRQKDRLIKDNGVNWVEFKHRVKNLFGKAQYNVLLSEQVSKILTTNKDVIKGDTFQEIYYFMRLAMFNANAKIAGLYRLNFLSKAMITDLKEKIVKNSKVSDQCYQSFLDNREPYILLMLDLTIVFSQLGAILTYINRITDHFGETAAIALCNVLISSQIISILQRLLTEYSQYLDDIRSIFNLIASEETSDFRILLNELEEGYSNLYDLLVDFDKAHRQNSRQPSQLHQFPTEYIMVVLEASKYFSHKYEQVNAVEQNICFKLPKAVEEFNEIITKSCFKPDSNIQKLIGDHQMTIGTIFDLTDHAQGYQLSLANLPFKETCDRFAQFKKIVTTNEQTYFKTYEDKTYYEIIVAQIDAVALSICEFISEHMEPHLQADFLRLEHWQAMNAEVMPELSSSTRMSTIAHPHNTNSDAAIILNIKSWINDAYIEYRETVLKLMLQKKATSWKPWRWEHHGDKGLIRAMKVRDLIFEETGLLQKLQVLYRFFTGYYHSLLRQYRENAHSFSTIIYNVLTNTDHYKSLRLFLNLHQREFTLVELKRNLSLYQQPGTVNARLGLIAVIRQREADSLRIRSETEITNTLS